MKPNSQVSVVLTQKGVDILRSRDIEFGLRLPITASLRNEVLGRALTYQEGMVHKCMMWELMSTFGPHMCAGSELPFNEITEV